MTNVELAAELRRIARRIDKEDLEHGAAFGQETDASLVMEASFRLADPQGGFVMAPGGPAGRVPDTDEELVGIVQIAVQAPTWARESGEWHCLPASVKRGALGSFSSGEGRRQVYVFGWRNGEGPAVWRSVAGVDIETKAQRVIVPLGSFEMVADLRAGPYEMDWHWGGLNRRIRLQAVEVGHA